MANVPVCGDPETAGLLALPGVGLDVHDAAGVVQDVVDDVGAVVGVERVDGRAGVVEAVDVVWGLWEVQVWDG